MNHDRLLQTLRRFKSGDLSERQMLDALRDLPYEDLGFAKVDHHRALRCGHAEVIFCPGKTPEQVGAIADAIMGAGNNLLATRASREVFELVKGRHPEARYHELARAVTVTIQAIRRRPGLVTIVCAGTSDIPVAEEARVTAEMNGSTVQTLYDVGVAGLHRLLAHLEALSRSTVIVVVAGMEGALASVVAGLVSVPVIAVPTSVGYGASFGGLAPLLTMLNSCAAGVSVVNIDNGFGAGHVASLINAIAAGTDAAGGDDDEGPAGDP